MAHVIAFDVNETLLDLKSLDEHFERAFGNSAWDVAGALQAGCKAAFVARPGMVMSPLGPQPDIVGASIEDVAEQILTTDA